MKKDIESRINESIEAKRDLLNSQVVNIESAVKAIIEALKNGKKLLVFGNGGSAADSQHIAAELVGRFRMERKALPAIALTANTSILTAIANDYGYDAVFSRQVEALGVKGDIALGISTSGNSKNVIEALKIARSIGMKTIALSGGDGGIIKREADISIVVAAKDTPRIQESHILIAHIICALVENGIFK
ncbi:MAG: D-sedoheptulose 7-phosphate isomerase [Candidatus Omnitrophota bacterium]|jgi:D-sedoheptulose 7-phosphate isomerase|nr:D-sedoheptulose 7-phosphate isomerase [Candidatus Omnitrophota bacterium]